MSGPGQWFVLAVEDVETGCPTIEERFRVADPERLRKALSGDFPDGCWIHIDAFELAALAEAFGVGRDLSGLEVMVGPWSDHRDAPYLIHTRFELFLMREGRKPFAAFCDDAAFLDELLEPFEPFVATSAIRRRDFEPRPTVHSDVILREVYFTLPGEEWRIQSYRELMADAERYGWSAAHERRQGELLGYLDWQNDWWAERAGQHHA